MELKILCNRLEDHKGNVYCYVSMKEKVIVRLSSGRKYIITGSKENSVSVRLYQRKDIYAKYGIAYKAGKIYHDILGWINPLLVNGNEKIGIGCYHFSMLPGTGVYTAEINGMIIAEKGTCVCDCIGCYAKTGNYNFPSVKKSLIIKTWLVRNDLDFVYNAICAQIEAENILYCRIHASGDFDNNLKYGFMWLKIAAKFPGIKFWTYTKIKRFETLFDGVENANIVKSVVPGIGINYGHCDYIINTYNELVNRGKKVHVCKCGIDKEQHCINCAGCSENEYVLFIEHSTEYRADQDSKYNAVKQLILSQEKTEIEKTA